jgi:hypothetical protein
MYKDTRSRHVVLFLLPAKYGYEGILDNVYQKSRCQWRVHVNPAKFSDYLCNSELAQCTAEDPAEAQWLHACQLNGGKRMGNQPMLKSLPCQSGDFEVCQIRPSAMFFTQRKMAEQVAAGHDRVVSVSQGGSNYRVCYSTHSSMEELERFVKHFAEGRTVITPCAIPVNSSREDVKTTLASWLITAEAGPTVVPDSDTASFASLSPHQPEPPTRACGAPDRFDSESAFSVPSPRHPSPGREARKRRLSSREEPAVKLPRMEERQLSPGRLEAWGWDSAARISFDDTMEVEGRCGVVRGNGLQVEGKQVAGEPDSSEEEEAERSARWVEGHTVERWTQWRDTPRTLGRGGVTFRGLK